MKTVGNIIDICHFLIASTFIIGDTHKFITNDN